METPLLISSETVLNEKPQAIVRSGFYLNDSTCKPNHYSYDVLKKTCFKNRLYKD